MSLWIGGGVLLSGAAFLAKVCPLPFVPVLERFSVLADGSLAGLSWWAVTPPVIAGVLGEGLTTCAALHGDSIAGAFGMFK